MDERAGTKMGWSWDCGKERCCLEPTSESKDQSKQQESFITPKAARIAAAIAVRAHVSLRLSPLWSFPKTTCGAKGTVLVRANTFLYCLQFQSVF